MAGTAITGFSLAFAHRAWITRLPVLHTADGTEFDKRKIVLYAYRHTYAQRHADAGVGIDVLRELMSHRQLDTTKQYQFRSGTLPGTDGPSGSTNLRSVRVIRPLDPRLSVIALWSLSETRCLRHPPPTTGCPAYVLITCLLRAPYSPSGRGSAP